MNEWAVIWLAVAVAFAVGEMASPGSFFLFPFAVGAAFAAGVAMFDGGTLAEWVVFLLVSTVGLVCLRPLARRLDQHGEDHGIGAKRLVGQVAVVTDAIPEGDLGTVRVHREAWRAESLDGTAIPEGASVRVSDVEGTRVVVTQLDPDGPPSPPPPHTPPTTTL